MKKRCLVAGLLVFVMMLSGCGSQSTTSETETTISSETASVEETVSSETVSSEVTDWGWLATDGAEMAQNYLEHNERAHRFLEYLAPYPYSSDKISLIFVSSCVIDRETSTDSDFYWDAKGHFYGEDEYGHNNGIYDFEIKVHSEGYPTSDYSFSFSNSDYKITDKK